jgi:hypothetical protein
MLRSSIIAYDGLPISSGGGHTLRTRSAVLALGQLRHFLASCTDASHPEDTFLEMVSGENVPEDFSAPLIMKLTNELGAPERLRHLGADNIAQSWPLSDREVDTYVAMIEEAKPLPVHPYKLQLFTVAALFRFHLVDSESCVVLPHQGPANYGNFSPQPGRVLGESTLYARISERSTFSLLLNFPFEEVSESFLQSAAFVERHLPFRLSSHHWKQWRLARNGKSYVGRKISFPVSHA